MPDIDEDELRVGDDLSSDSDKSMTNEPIMMNKH
jgi:hypothetical protein